MLKTNLTTALACALLTIAAPGSAQEQFPSKPIRMLVPFSAGSATDFFARLLGAKMTEHWGQQVVIDNRPSAGGVIASETLLAAPPDGYTLMLVSVGHAVNASLYTKLPYDTVKDFAGITLVADTPTVLVVTPSLGLKTVKDLVDLAKSKPGQINYASAGIGSGAHMNAEQFKLATGINVVHVPFKGTPEALTNVIGGSVSFFFSPITGAVTLVKGGKITALAVSTKERSPVLPDLPSATEVGVPGFEFNLWTGLLGPAKMPKDVKDKLNKEAVGILSAPDVKERMLTQGATPHPMSPAQFDAFIKSEVERLAKVVKASGAKAD
ncbi:MAG TPA: tripartite tricarboxylate transporter substrate binding protein [Burkholderiales bacterium]|jgi:tripartite-type tricarboxylate transporter receptor subunit TctC|nr:tripartite tricarboxylate transporter substrate binding protein [Burkholderiales bacterium]